MRPIVLVLVQPIPGIGLPGDEVVVRGPDLPIAVINRWLRAEASRALLDALAEGTVRPAGDASVEEAQEQLAEAAGKWLPPPRPVRRSRHGALRLLR